MKSELWAIGCGHERKVKLVLGQSQNNTNKVRTTGLPLPCPRIDGNKTVVFSVELAGATPISVTCMNKACRFHATNTNAQGDTLPV